jgi:hypothetical protein
MTSRNQRGLSLPLPSFSSVSTLGSHHKTDNAQHATPGSKAKRTEPTFVKIELLKVKALPVRLATESKLARGDP